MDDLEQWLKHQVLRSKLQSRLERKEEDSCLESELF